MTPGRAPSQDTRQALISTGARITARKGFRAVGLNEILAAARVPKGSFYHYFESKDAFGQEIMRDYFVAYLASMDRIFGQAGPDAAARLLTYLDAWRDRQSAEDFTSGCLVVTLGPEAANLSPEMRGVIRGGVDEIVDRLRRIIAEGVTDGSITSPDPRLSAELLYETWVGASIVAKIRRDAGPFDAASTATRQHLRIG